MSDETEDAFDLSGLIPSDEGQPEPTPEPEPEEETPEQEPAQDEADGGELPEAEKPQSEPDQTAELRDKELQKIQQLRATYAREVERLQQQGNQPTEKQVERVEKASSKLEKYLKEVDLDPYQAARDISEEVLANADRAERALQDYEGKLRAMQEREAARDAEMARMRFSADYPDLKGRYDEFASKTSEAMLERFGDDLKTMSPSVYVKIANEDFLRRVKAASSKLEGKPEKSAPPEDSAKKPKAARPIKTKSGGTVQTPMDSEAKGEHLLSQIAKEMFGG